MAASVCCLDTNYNWRKAKWRLIEFSDLFVEEIWSSNITVAATVATA
jgi:hypothetical protein